MFQLLETQQQLAVAISTDKRKDIMIEQLDKVLVMCHEILYAGKYLRRVNFAPFVPIVRGRIFFYVIE